MRIKLAILWRAFCDGFIQLENQRLTERVGEMLNLMSFAIERENDKETKEFLTNTLKSLDFQSFRMLRILIEILKNLTFLFKLKHEKIVTSSKNEAEIIIA